jgi:hypothetical protein
MPDKTEATEPEATFDLNAVAEENRKEQVEEALADAPAKTRKAKSKLTELHEGNLVQENDGSPHPIYVTTEHLQATVVTDLGRPLLKLSLLGWVGDESIVLPIAQAGEIREIADLLEAEAGRR